MNKIPKTYFVYNDCGVNQIIKFVYNGCGYHHTPIPSQRQPKVKNAHPSPLFEINNKSTMNKIKSMLMFVVKNWNQQNCYIYNVYNRTVCFRLLRFESTKIILKSLNINKTGVDFNIY